MFNFSEQLSNLYTSVVENLTDSHKATIIWNNEEADLDTKKKLLMGIAMTTEDEKLKGEILNRIAIEETKYICFKSIDESSVYVIVSIEDHRRNVYGVFTNYGAARRELEFMLDDDIRFDIEKRTLYDEDSDKFKEDATMVLNARGDIMAIYAKEPEELDTSEGFEDQFIDIPFDLKRGTIVKYAGHDEYYVLAHDFESIREFYHDHKENPGKYLSNMDFSDNQIRGLSPLKDGTWYHYHLNIFNISPCTEEDLVEIDGDEEHNALMRALKAAREYFTNTEDDEWNSLADSVLAASKEYAKVCFDKNDDYHFDKYTINTKEIKCIDDFMY